MRRVGLVALLHVFLVIAGCGGGGSGGTTTSSGGGGSSSTSFAVTSLSVAGGPLSGGFLLTIKGRGFDPVVTVTVGGQPASNIQVNTPRTEITCTAPGSVTPGPADVVVTSTPHGSATVKGGITYNTPPTISLLSPTSGSTSGGSNLTITGTNFLGQLLVTIGGQQATSPKATEGGTVLTCVTPAGVEGQADVVVTCSESGTVSMPRGYSYTVPGPNSPPVIGTVSPATGPVNGGTQMTISGSGFGKDAQVAVGARFATNVEVKSGQITCLTPPADETGLVDVVVTNDAGSTRATGAFTYTAPPNLADVSPDNGPSQGGTEVTLTGTDFNGAITVFFAKQKATQVRVSTDRTQIKCLTPPSGNSSTNQVVDVTVTTANGGTTTLASIYTYNGPPPTISSVIPNSGPAIGGTLVSITGDHFEGDSTVTIGSLPAQGVNIIDDQHITFLTPPTSTLGATSVVVRSETNGTVTANNAFTYNNLPVIGITEVKPNIGPVAGNTPITIKGVNFLGSVSVTIGGKRATNVLVASGPRTGEGIITCRTPRADTAGAVDVVVTSTANGSATSVLGFTYAPAVGIDTILPVSGPLAGGTRVAVNGFNFGGIVTVLFGSKPLTELEVNGAKTQITGLTPAGSALGDVDVTVISDENGTAVLQEAFQYLPNPPPTITSITPDNGPLSGGTLIKIKGSDFRGAVTVTIGGTTASSPQVSSDFTEITCTTPRGGAIGPADVIVNSTVNGTVTRPGGFTYNPSPIIDSVTPGSGPLAGGTTLTIRGRNLTGASSVTIGTNLADNLQVISSTEVTCVTPKGTTAGSVNVILFSPVTGTGTATNGFTYNNLPTVAEIKPNSGPVSGRTPITITGSGFTGVVTVTIGGKPLVGPVVTPTQITGDTPAGTNAIAVDVVVASSSTGVLTIQGGFTYNPPPTITTISPSSGGLAGTNQVVIEGTHFQGNMSVTFDGKPATGVKVTNTTFTQLTCIVPAGNSPGSVDVVVTSDMFGSATAEGGYIYIPPLEIGDIVPNRGPVGGGTIITINGANFVGSINVSIGTAPCTSISVSGNKTQIFCITGASATAGTKDVFVNSDVSGTAFKTGAFTYFPPPPAIDTISPASGPQGGGTTVVITGINFGGNVSVSIGGVAATVQSVTNSGRTITLKTGASPTPGLKDVIVTSDVNGTVTAVSAFTYNAATTCTFVTPNKGPQAGGTLITVDGTNFLGVVTVSVGAALATNVQVISPNQLQCRTPVGPPGAVDVVVRSSTNGDGTKPGGFTYTPLPVVTNVSPKEGPLAGGTRVTISGDNFGGTVTVGIGTTVTNAVPCTIVQLDPNEKFIIILTPPSTSTGAKDLYITSSANGQTTARTAFTYDPPCVFTDIQPDNGPQVGLNALVIHGRNFGGVVTVAIGGVNAPVSSVTGLDTIFCTAPPNTGGKKDVLITSTFNGTVTGVQAYNYNSLITVTNINPAVGPASGGTPIVITGTNFGGSVTVSIGGAPTTNVSLTGTTRINCVTPAGTVGDQDVLITSSTNGPFTVTRGFKYLDVSRVDSITPNNGPLVGLNTVLISGANFGATTSVTIGGKPTTNVSVSSDGNNITCTVPPGFTPGQVDVIVASPTNGTVTKTKFYTYNQPLSLSGVNPTSGPTAGNQIITITGANFGPTVTVSVGSALATNTQVVSPTQITCQTPPAAIRPNTVAVVVSITVNSPSNGVATLGNAYTYNPDTTVTNVAPPSGPLVGNTFVTITGTNFFGNVSVVFGSANAPQSSISVNGAKNSLTCLTPAGVGAGKVDVFVISDTHGTGVLPLGYQYNDLPTVTGPVSPSSGPLAGGTIITIDGVNFGPSVSVSVGSKLAAFPTVNPSQTRITCTTPSATTPGAVDVVILSPTNGTRTISNGFTYNRLPSFAAVNPVSPPNGPQAGNTLVTINGNDFGAVQRVLFGANPVPTFQVVSDQVIICRTPPGTISGKTDITIDSITNGVTTGIKLYTYNAPPRIDDIDPDNGPLAGGTRVTITGANYDPTLTVSIGNVPANITFVSVGNDTIIVDSPPGAAPGTVPVGVNSTADGFVSAIGFTYNTTDTITKIEPNVGPLAGGTKITITGPSFGNPISSVLIGATPATDVTLNVSGTTITCITPANPNPGPVSVTVNSTPNGAATAASGFTYLARPTIALPLVPNSGPISGMTRVTINGTGFGPTIGVTFGSRPATNVQVNTPLNTQITCDTPAEPTGAAVTVDLSLDSTANGTATALAAFTYNTSPSITRILPDNGPLAGGQTITIFGASLGPTATVSVGSALATNVTINTSATQITCVTPAALLPATVPVTVNSTLNGQITFNGYTYNPTPTITNVTPLLGPLAGNTLVTIDGTNLNPSIGVTFGTLPASNITFTVTGSQLRCMTPPGLAVGPVTVLLDSTANGTATFASYTYTVTPTIADVTPKAGPVNGGTSITITGTSFNTPLTVTVGGAAAATTSISPTQIIAVTPPSAVTGATDVVVNSTPNGIVTAANAFTYNPSTAAPTNANVGRQPRGLALGDLNGDGKLDIVTANQQDNNVSVLISNTGAGAGSPSFLAASPFAVGSTPVAAAVGDMNLDGKLDVVAVNSVDKTFSILVNQTPAGSTTPGFFGHQDYATNNSPTAVVVRDFNGDGKQDVVVANQGANTVTVFLNSTVSGNTSPTFFLANDFACGVSPTGLAVADFNADGVVDLAVANQGDNTVAVLLNQTTAGSTGPNFGPPTAFTLPASSLPSTVAARDLNGDGKADLVVTNTSVGSVSVFFNTSTPGTSIPTFSAATNFVTDATPTGLGLGDLNGDGRPDIVTGNSAANSVSLLLNSTTPGGTTPLFGPASSPASGTGPQALLLGDINGDGKLDIVNVNTGGDSVSILLNTTGVGAFPAAFTSRLDVNTNSGPAAAVSDDFSGAGKPDIAVVNTGAALVSALANNTAAGATTFNFSRTDATAGTNPQAIAAGDLNGDGKIDIVSANQSGDSVTVLFNTTPAGSGSRSFSATNFAAGLGGTIPAPRGVTLADINLDGRLDIIVANSGTNEIGVLLNSTPAGFGTPSFGTPQVFAAQVVPRGVAAGDVNGDGLIDIACVNDSSQTVSVLLNQTTPGSVTVAFLTQTPFTVQQHPASVVFFDFDGDGRKDLAVANSGTNNLSVFRNTTTVGTTATSFGTPLTVSTVNMTTPVALAVGDLNGDGLPDLAVADAGKANFTVLLNKTTPGATTPSFDNKDIATPANVTGIAIGDFNGDYKPDVAAVIGSSNFVSVFRNITTP